MIRIISFDLDGTLVDEKMDGIFWNEEIPRLYSVQHNVSLNEAKKRVKEQYYNSGLTQSDPEWYTPEPWFKKFNIKEDPKKIIEDLKHHITIYKNSKIVLDQLKKDFRVILVTHSTRHFVDIKLKAAGITFHFDTIISVPSDLKVTKKSKEVYQQIIKNLGVRVDEILHIGNTKTDDYDVPKSIGIHCLLIDRSKKLKGPDIIHSLTEIKNHVK